MSSWYSSWFSSLPTFDFAVPSNIQRRFFSFLLRRTLGHFLKPGQLDLHQIDSQLGSGVVHVKDLELDGQAINQLLLGLPVSLYDGFISGVTARIPFPNPLSSSVGFHVQSLNLTFQVTPEHSISPISPTFLNNSNLTESVVSVAETFIHDELTPREEATLRQTLKPSADSPPLPDETESLPGGFGPFVNNSGTEDGHKARHGDDDPAGVSVFATLIERLLAKFEFSALDTKITVIYPGRASFTLSVAEITYHTEPSRCSESNIGPQSTSLQSEHSGQTRTASIFGLRVTSRDLRVATSSPTASRTLSPVSFTSSRTSSPQCSPPVNQSSRNSSSSSLDEDIQLQMSQSIAMLPPRSPPLSSVADSMYQSAVSMTYAQPAEVDVCPTLSSVLQITKQARSPPRPSVPCHDSAEEVLLSFGSQPIVFSLKTPSRRTQPSEQPPQPSSSQQADVENFGRDMSDNETLQLSITIGVLACAFRSRHLRIFLDIADACIPKAPTAPTPRKDASPSDLPRTTMCLEANVVLRGIVAIALPEPATGEICPLDAYFNRPLVPPRLPRTYLRLFIDTISISSRLSTSPSDLPMSGVPRLTSSVPLDQSISAKMLISDISIFAFHAFSSKDELQIAAPILITDPYLPTLRAARHYRPSLVSERPQDIKLPEFEVLDWTQAKFKRGSAKLSTWRSRNRAVPGKADRVHTPSQKTPDLPGSPNPFISSPVSEPEDKLSMPPAIEVSGQLALPLTARGKSHNVDIKITPLHLFFDLGMVFKDNLVIHFVEDIASAAVFTPKKTPDTEFHQQNHEELSEDELDGERDLQVQRISARAREREQERKRLEALVLEDLSLGTNNPRSETLEPQKFSRQQSASLKRRKAVPGESVFGFNLTCPMIRVEIRCPPAPSHPPRSGSMLLDFRGLSISNTPHPSRSSLRFSDGVPPRPSNNTSNVIMNICLREMLAAYSLVGEHMARAIVTFGFLPAKEVGHDASMLMATETTRDTLPLSVVLERHSPGRRSSRNSSSKLSVTVDIPLVNLVADKAVFDGLQYWADDMAQLTGQNITNPGGGSGALLSRNPSLIGSRYFTQPRRSATNSTDERITESANHQNTGEITVKVSITEVLLRFIVPRVDGPRPLDIFALDVDAFIELKPEGKNESAVSAGIVDLSIMDTPSEGHYVLLVQGPTRSLSSLPKPSVKCRVTSLVIPETIAKETRIRLSLWGFTVQPPLDSNFGSNLAAFTKAPPGVFESVVPSECTRITMGVVDVSVHLRAPGHPGALALHFGEAEFSTELVGNSSESAFTLKVSSSHFFLVDSIHDALESTGGTAPGVGVEFWKNSGYALIAEVIQSQLDFRVNNAVQPPDTSVVIERIGLRIHLCADTISALTSLMSHMTPTSKDRAVASPRTTARTPNTISGAYTHDMTASLDEHAFRLMPEVGSTADMISDDLPANQDYLDASFGAAAGLRELRDDDFEDFDTEEQTGRDTPVVGQLGIVSNVGGETIRILKPFSFVEHYFDTIPPNTSRDADSRSDTTLRIRIHKSDVFLFLHDGFDWPRTRRIIEKEVKEMRKRLARIRQLAATGQAQEPWDEATSATLFNSFHIGLERDLENMDTDAIIAAIDEELDNSAEIGTESSWQSLHPASPGRPQVLPTRVYGKRLTRSKGPSIEIRLQGLNAEIDNYRPGETLVSRTLILVKDLEILDHIKSSTWKKFLTDMRSDSRGNVRETDSNMARVELLSVRPSPSHPAEEARLRAKILPLRLYVDQDALDFFKKFFAFQDPDSPPVPEDGEKKDEIYFQHAEVFPVDIKLDYKPRRVDYRALRNGRTIELMNFFHFDGAEMTLRHLTLNGITGWARFFDTLNDLWTPDVKATQLVDVISGVSPIRSVVNVGSGVADLILLPIAQYKKDGRIVRGVQKGTKAFVQSTAMEAIKLGARLATGTQVILEQAESVLGGHFKDSVTAEALHIPYESEGEDGAEEDLISRYAAQPTGLKEGVHSAYRSLQRNLLSAAQTILAVPMEVYERSGDEGAVRAVVRAVPIAVLKPMIGASEAVSKTLMGLHNTLDPNVQLENEAKYKHR